MNRTAITSPAQRAALNNSSLSKSKKTTTSVVPQFVPSDRPDVTVKRRGRPPKLSSSTQKSLLSSAHSEQLAHLGEIYHFVKEYSDELQGYFPSRQFLLNKGRSDLVPVVKKLGGPQVVSSKLHLTWSTERERERQIHEETRETLNAAAASPLGPLPSTSYANPPSPIYAAQVQRVICNLLTRGKHFHVEHSESNNESSNYWRMWYTPISSSEYTPSEGLSKILLEAHKCAQAHRSHYVRIAAVDPATQTQMSSFVLFKPNAPIATIPSKFSTRPYL